ncbi:MAG: hypothetical protein GY772_24250 [bacterium]|nr:hypothetical protein [bacterium]
MNQAFCMDCKRHLDVLAKQARNQQRQEWFGEVRNDPGKCQQLLAAYTKVKRASPSGKAGKGEGWNLMQYIEALAVQSGTQHLAQGKMMWEREAIEFWQTTPGGRTSEEDAKARWAEWVKRKDELGIVHDLKGPNPQFPLRLRVPTGDEVNYATSYIREKRMSCEAAAKKKPTQDDLDRVSRKCLLDHEKIGNPEGDVALHSIAQRLVTGANGDALEGGNVLIGDITDLLQTAESGSDPVAPDATAAATAGNEDEKAEAAENEACEPSAKKQKSWFDKDRACLAARRELQATMAKVRAESEAARRLVPLLFGEVGDGRVGMGCRGAERRVGGIARVQRVQRSPPHLRHGKGCPTRSLARALWSHCNSSVSRGSS